MGIETGTALLIGGLAGGGSSLAGGLLQKSAAGDAADAQLKATREALQFQLEQAAQGFANAEATRRGNYDQWAAQQGRLSTLGQMLGMKPFTIPAYVPLQRVQTANPYATSMGRVWTPALRGWNPPGSSTMPVD